MERKLYLCRDEDGGLNLFYGKPHKEIIQWEHAEEQFICLANNLFPEIKWEDEEPKEVEIHFAINKK